MMCNQIEDTYSVVGGGPLDGGRILVEKGTRIHFHDTTHKFNEDWVHCYIRLNNFVFAYDGLRDLDSLINS